MHGGNARRRMNGWSKWFRQVEVMSGAVNCWHSSHHYRCDYYSFSFPLPAAEVACAAREGP